MQSGKSPRRANHMKIQFFGFLCAFAMVVPEAGRVAGAVMTLSDYESESSKSIKPSETIYTAATAGKIASLPCRVKSLGNKTVSWLRHRDLHLLTVGIYTYTTDQRFRANHLAGGETWNLEIRYVQERDAGIYECQMGSTPTFSQYINLTVVEASSVILGGPELFIDRGSTINLTCLVRHSEPPEHVFWTNNDKRINYDSPRGGVIVLTERYSRYTTVSSLRLLKAREKDAGLYKCRPTSGDEAAITVHVLNGEFPAAMQRSHQSPDSLWIVVVGVTFAVVCSSGFWR